MDPLYNKSTGGIPHNKLGCACSEGFQELCGNHDDETGDCKIALANFRNMNKKIIGFKLIKLYPLSENIFYIFNDPSKEIIDEYLMWPEFWEPIYDGIVDLQKIISNTDLGKGIIFNGYPYYNNQPHVINMIIEACRQTLELVNQRISIDPEQRKVIRETINLIR